MNYFVRKLCFLLILAVCAGIVAGLLWQDRQQRQSESQRIQLVAQQAAPYEQELQKIYQEVQVRKNGTNSDSATAGAVICFVPGGAEDLSRVEAIRADRGFTPVIALDCDLGEQTLRQIARQASQAGFGLMLMAGVFDQNDLATADALKEELTGSGVSQPAFLLRRNDDTPGNRELLKAQGFENLFRYSETLADEVQGNLRMLPYGFIRSQSSGSSLASQLIAAHSSVALMFDLRTGDLSDDAITAFLKELDGMTAQGQLEYRDVSNAFSVLAQKAAVEQQALAELEAYLQAQDARMAELEELIQQIYTQGG